MSVKIKGCLWKPGVNGLGVLGFHKLPYRKRFNKAARSHDYHYDLAGNWWARREYDILFLQNMVDVCENTLQVSVAVAYYYVVRLFGWAFFNYKD
jgi:hypothetical protein